MITGYFAGGERPVVDAEVLLPRLNRLMTVAFLVDTGADGTVLSSRDWARAGMRFTDFSASRVRSVGVGGVVECAVESAVIRITEQDGSTDELPVEIEIQPRTAGSLVVPSFLGRDLLRQYTLRMSIQQRVLTLDRER